MKGSVHYLKLMTAMNELCVYSSYTYNAHCIALSVYVWKEIMQ